MATKDVISWDFVDITVDKYDSILEVYMSALAHGFKEICVIALYVKNYGPSICSNSYCFEELNK